MFETFCKEEISFPQSRREMRFRVGWRTLVSMLMILPECCIVCSIPLGEGGGIALPDKLQRVGSRVINGVPVTDKNEYPFVVDLSADEAAVSSSRFCTGTLLKPDIVLTAAHCVLNNGYTGHVFATVGKIVLDDADEANSHAETFRTVASIVHEDYKGLGSAKDVALMLLNRSSSARTVALANARPRENDETWVVGYGIQTIGTIEETSTVVEVMSSKLQKTSLRVMDNKFCDVPEAKLTTDAGMLCTAGVKEGSSACKGDSGGGLFLISNRTDLSNPSADAQTNILQVGIVSYGSSDCHSEESGVFTDVANVKAWIEDSAVKLHDAFKPVRLQSNDTSIYKMFSKDKKPNERLIPKYVLHGQERLTKR